ncbi:Glucuronosyltransferase [Aphelenchoides besseyi]|nr:Glucuronosyltransferase [Aphelenchoides besseyi]
MNSELFFVLLLLLPATVNGYKILVYSPSISRSHLISNARVAEVLARDGHDVTLLQLDYGGDYELKLVQHARLWTETFPWPNRESVLNTRDFANSILSKGNVLYDYYRMLNWQNRLNDACEHVILAKDLLDKIKKEKFDVYIGEQLDLCGSGLSKALDIPIHILLHSCPLMQHITSFIGLQMPSSRVPTMAGYGGITDKMNIIDRYANLVYASFEWAFHMWGSYKTTRLYQRHFGSDFPSISEIVGSSPLVLVNVDEFVDFPRPVTHNMVYIGGLGLHDTKNTSLTAPFDLEMQKGKNGVILISFGSVVPTTYFPNQLVENLMNTIRNLTDYHFLLKVDKTDKKIHEASKGISNVYLSSWLPQPAILQNPRLSLFITHGGYNSVIESARFGVPLVLVGFFGDQTSNSMVVERNGWGCDLSKIELMKPSNILETKIRTVLENERFKKAAKRTQRLVMSKPTSAEQRLTSWMRFLEENDGKLPELQNEGRHLSTIEYYNLDLMFLAATSFILVIYVLSKFIHVIYRLARREELKLKRS